MVVDAGNPAHVRAAEVTQGAPVVLDFERGALVFDPGVEARHVVAHVLDDDPHPEQLRREDDAAVRQPDLRILDAVRPRLFLPVLETLRVVDSESRGHVLVMVVVAERADVAELARRGQPVEHH